jgi:uncharacterized protein (DUF2126 family)
VVSGRAVAALVAQLLLAPRRRTDLDEPALLDDEKRIAASRRGRRAVPRRRRRAAGLAPKHIFAAFEDAFYYLWRERRLPSNVDPFKSKLEDPQERARLAKVFEQGLDSVVGHVLPVSRDPSGTRWRTGPWFLRRERCYLIPGDSPWAIACRSIRSPG